MDVDVERTCYNKYIDTMKNDSRKSFHVFSNVNHVRVYDTTLCLFKIYFFVCILKAIVKFFNRRQYCSERLMKTFKKAIFEFFTKL